jgi:hypothetical protein
LLRTSNTTFDVRCQAPSCLKKKSFLETDTHALTAREMLIKNTEITVSIHSVFDKNWYNDTTGRNSATYMYFGVITVYPLYHAQMRIGLVYKPYALQNTKFSSKKSRHIPQSQLSCLYCTHQGTAYFEFREVKRYVLRHTNLLVLYGIMRNYHSSGSNLLLYQFIKRMIRWPVIMIEESLSYRLPIKFYSTFFWPG